MTDKADTQQPFAAVFPAVLFVTAIFLCNFLSRVILAPLMPVIQADLGFTHAGAGHLFLALAVGNGTGLLLSGFISRVVQHRRTVGISAMLVGATALFIPQAGTYSALMAGLYALGVAVGLYLPSGIATLTSLVRKEDWGKTMAAHEMAPNLSYVAAPLMAEAVLLVHDWRSALYYLGVLQLCLGFWFIKSGRGGNYPGVVPGPEKIAQTVKRPIFWILVLFMSMAVGASIGPYTMIPLYLVDSHGYTRETANHLLSISRVAACFMPFLAGWITDRWGARPAILISLLSNGLALLGLGFAQGDMLTAMVLLQPACSVLMFAPGFTVIAMAFGPKHRPVAIALMGPLNATIGIGLFPTFLGHMGDAGMFGTGFMIQGCLLLAALFFIPVLPKGRAGA